ncbi:hypothetical protein ACWC4D_34645 [Streptomyces sp. NPDC001288]|uniref:hypothetical protein n=1 Tax=Streptomyces sp. NPDC001297 TaxID=3364559 RepID=UPI0036CE78EB
MQMTESFASTGAAVAPVLWAIGTVELQQLRKRWQSWVTEQERQYNEAVVAMSEASDEESLARAQGLWGRAQRWWLGPLPPFGLYGAWISLSAGAFLFITVLPACVVWLDLEHWRKHVKRAGRALGYLNAQAHGRVQERLADQTHEPPRA